jgi:HAD superfamily hydrolase (TIGR01509 family)
MIKAIIFDMDGVISDTQKLHSQVESQLLARHGIKISPKEISKKYSGVRTKEFFEDLLKGKNCDLDELIDMKWKEMKKLASLNADEIPGAIKLIKKLRNEGFVLAVASASNLDYVKTILNSLNIIPYFKTIVSGDMVSKGKPDPESFLLAAKKINLNPKECLVIEDGISGMEAAKKAGMNCIGLVSDKNRSYPTFNLVLSLGEVYGTISNILNLQKT